MNKFEFLGRLTKDPEVRYTSGNNTQVTTFTIAVNRRFVAQGGERQSDFFNLTAFGKSAEFCSKYFKKGQQVLVIAYALLALLGRRIQQPSVQVHHLAEKGQALLLWFLHLMQFLLSIFGHIMTCTYRER